MTLYAYERKGNKITGLYYSCKVEAIDSVEKTFYDGIIWRRLELINRDLSLFFSFKDCLK